MTPFTTESGPWNLCRHFRPHRVRDARCHKGSAQRAQWWARTVRFRVSQHRADRTCFVLSRPRGTSVFSVRCLFKSYTEIEVGDDGCTLPQSTLILHYMQRLEFYRSGLSVFCPLSQSARAPPEPPPDVSTVCRQVQVSLIGRVRYAVPSGRWTGAGGLWLFIIPGETIAIPVFWRRSD